MGSVLDSVVSFVGRPFGIYTHDETFTDIQIIDLLTPDKADSAARNVSIRNSGGNASKYFTSYRAFQRQYKRRYSKKFLENLGYAPSNNATTRVIDETLVKDYLQSTLSYIHVSVEDAYDLYLNLDRKAKYGRQFVTGYDHTTTSVTNGGKVYTYSTSEEVSPTEIKLKFVRNFNDSIIDNLTDNYMYDSLAVTVSIGGELYDVGTISSAININDEYETVCTHQGATLPDEVILTTVERYDENYIDALFDKECTYVEYRVTSGEIDNSTRYFINLADTLPIYIHSDIAVTAIIPMKENNVIANDDNKLKRMLKKLNLSYDQLIESIENPDMDSAYLMTGLNTTVDNDPHNKVMFKMFDLVAPGNGNITISISSLSMTYSFTIVKSTTLGNVAPVGKYVRTGLNSGGVTLQYQGSPTEYQQIVISNFSHRYVISGQTFNGGFTDSNTRLILPIELFNKLKYREWVNVYERSLCMLGYSIEVVEVKWYETSAFGFILQIVGFVLALPSGGTSLAFTELAKTVLINLLIAQVAIILAEAIGGTLGAIIGAAVAIYLSYEFGSLGDIKGSELWLKAADKGLSTIQQYVENETVNKMAEFQSDLDSLDRKIKEMNDSLEELSDDPTIYATNSLAFNTVGSPNKIFYTIEQYVNNIVNTEWLVDAKWLYDIDGEIATRNSVYVG